MVYYVAVLIFCLVFLSGVVLSPALHEIHKPDYKAPNDTVIRVFNSDCDCNIWRKIKSNQSTPSQPVSKNKRTRFHTNSTWSSSTFGDPYFDGYLSNLKQQSVDKVTLFKALKSILDRKPIKISEESVGEKHYNKVVRAEVNSPRTAHTVTAVPKSFHLTTEENNSVNQILSNLESASEHLKRITCSLEEELKKLSKIRLGMEKTVCGNKEVKSQRRKINWGDWSSWSACSVTCGESKCETGSPSFQNEGDRQSKLN